MKEIFNMKEYKIVQEYENELLAAFEMIPGFSTKTFKSDILSFPYANTENSKSHELMDSMLEILKSMSIKCHIDKMDAPVSNEIHTTQGIILDDKSYFFCAMDKRHVGIYKANEFKTKYVEVTK